MDHAGEIMVERHKKATEATLTAINSARKQLFAPGPPRSEPSPAAPLREQRHSAVTRASLATLREMANDAGAEASELDSRGTLQHAVAGAAIGAIDLAEYLDAARVRAAFRQAAGPEGLVREVKFPPLPRLAGLPTFVAIDFETADAQRDSACSLAVVRVEQGALVEARSYLIRPERPPGPLAHEWIHGITWSMVRRAPRFAEVWARCLPLLEGAQWIAAHNASFDQSVLAASCRNAGLPEPKLPWECTVKHARRVLQVKSARLPTVCKQLGIALEHHDPLSDAVACAQIMVATLILDATTKAAREVGRTARVTR